MPRPSYRENDLRGMSLANNQLSGWDLSQQDLTGADFENSDLTGVDLTDAIINDVRLHRIQDRITAEQFYATANYQTNDFQGIDIEDMAMGGWDFSEKNLQGLRIARADLSGANFRDATFADVVLDSVRLQDADLSGAQLGGHLRIRDANEAQFSQTINFRNRDLSNIDSLTIDMTGWDLRDFNLTGLKVGGSRMTDADLTNALIQGADFSGGRSISEDQLYSTASYVNGDLQGVAFNNYTMRGWIFRGRDLTAASFVESRLPEANFEDSLLNSAHFHRADLSLANLAGASVSAADFSLAEAASSDWSHSNGVLANFSGAVLRRADFTGADLSGARFDNADLSGSLWSDAQIDGASFADSLVSFLQIKATKSFADRAMQGLGLQNLSLSDWELYDQDLRGADFTGAVTRLLDVRMADLRHSVGWRGPASEAHSRNTIRPDGSVQRLQLRAGETMVVRNDAATAAKFDREILPTVVEDAFVMEPASTLEIRFDAAGWSTPIRIEAEEVQLSGQLVVHADTHMLQSGSAYSLFAWPDGIDLDGTFDSITVPAGTRWDFSRFYTEGLAILNSTLAADFDADADVDSSDLLTFLGGWTGDNYNGPPRTLDEGDLDGDGDVDTNDQLQFFAGWTGALAAPPDAPPTVPEPVLSPLVWLVGLMLSRRSRGNPRSR